jgi:hypothetical protein
MCHRHTTAYEKATSPPILSFPPGSSPGQALMGGKGPLTRTPPPSEGEDTGGGDFLRKAAVRPGRVEG